MNNFDLILGYDYDEWYGYGRKTQMVTDISSMSNSHILICGMSGSGKSYSKNLLFAKIATLGERRGKIYFADFKQDDQFLYLRKCPRYFPYDKTLEALEIVYEIMHKRQSGEDDSRDPITLI